MRLEGGVAATLPTSKDVNVVVPVSGELLQRHERRSTTKRLGEDTPRASRRVCMRHAAVARSVGFLGGPKSLQTGQTLAVQRES
jgi:hypothetical protein